MKKRVLLVLLGVVVVLAVGVTWAASPHVTYLPILITSQGSAQPDQVTGTPSPTPCVIDWTVPDTTENYLEILRCNRELHPPDGIIPLCPPLWSAWAFSMNVGICQVIINGTPVPVTPQPTPLPYP